MMNATVEQLCESAKSGDLAAASELLRQFYQLIYAFFRRLCGDEAEAADLTQKTFIKVWNSLASFRGLSSFSTWLHSIAWHTYQDWRRQRHPIEFPTDQWWEQCPDSGPDPAHTAAQRDAAAQLYALVDRLPESDKVLVHLHYYQGLSLNDTAQAARLPLSTVKYRLHEALQRLKSQLAERQLS